LGVPLAIDFHWPQSVQWNGIFFHATCNAVVQSKGPPKFSLASAADLAFFFLMGCKIATEQIQKKMAGSNQKKRNRFKVCSTCLRCVDGCIDEGD